MTDEIYLIGIIVKKFGSEGQSCFLFPSARSAAECKAYAISKLRKDDVLKEDEVSIRIFDIDVRLYAVFFPAAKTPIVIGFWQNAGVVISSRIAEDSLKHIDLLREVTDDNPLVVPTSPAHSKIQDRIAGLLERSPIKPLKVSPNDVYLFQTGMSAIYSVHQFLLPKYNGTSVLFGFAFHSTIHIFEDWENPGFKFFGRGTSEDTEALEEYCESETKEGRKIQAVWAEFPSNPILITPDLLRLRKLADKYGFALIIDDTIGSFCNVDLLSVADIVITSLTKSFSGYADVMAASAVLNPSSRLYPELKSLFERVYQNNFYSGDAEVLESNSRNYLERSKVLNANAEALTTYLQSCVQDPSSSVAKVYYPLFLPSLQFYKAFMRPASIEFTPGYGCLFSVEFKTVDALREFYENLNVHIGPHLGAHLTLALPYVKGLYGKTLDEVAKWDLRETQIRISSELEDTAELVQTFKNAVELANNAMVRGKGVEEGVAVGLI